MDEPLVEVRGYAEWRSAFDAGEATVWTITVAEVIDHIAQTLAQPEAVGMRRQLTEEWSIELDEEYAGRVFDDKLQLVARSHPRTIWIVVWSPPESEEPRVLLERVKRDAEPTPEWFTEEQGADAYELRYASWYAEPGHRGTQYSLYGYTIRRGSIVQGIFISDAADDREWALASWRSLRYRR